MNKPKWELIEVPKIEDKRGNLSFIESKNQIPFEIKRIFYLYQVRKGEVRGSHAHKELHQYLIPISGSFNVELSNGFDKDIIFLNKPNKGLYLPPLIWATEFNFSKDAVCLVLASDIYREDDYYRSYKNFINAIKGQ